MEAQEIPGAARFSIQRGRTACQTEFDEAFIVWAALGQGTAAGPPVFAETPEDTQEGGETKNTDIKEECVRKINRFLKHKDGGKEGK